MCGCKKEYDKNIVMQICKSCLYYYVLPFDNMTVEACRQLPNRTLDGFIQSGECCPQNRWPEKKS